MNVKKKQMIAVLMTTVSSANIVWAAPSTTKSGDWMITDSNPGEKTVGTCTALTAGYYNREVMDLIVRLEKSGARPAEILIRPRSKASTVKAFKAAAPGGKTAIFQKLAASSFGQTVFWYVPNGTDDLINQFKATKQFTGFAVDGAGSLPFSMSGSSGALNNLFGNCAGPAAIAQAASFENAFSPANIGALNGTTASPENASAARELIPTGIVAHRNVQKVQTELANLEAKYAAINAEKRSLDSTLANLVSRLSSLTSQKIQAQNTIDTATAEIASFQEKIALKQQELVPAEVAAKAATDAIAPFVPEHDRLLQIVNRADRDLNNVTSELASLDSQISANISRLDSLERESSDLSWRIRSVQEQETRTRQQLDQAERDFRSFNPEREIRERTRNDFQLNNIERNISDQARLSEQLERQLNQNIGAKNAIENAYNQCMANAGAQRIEAVVVAAVTFENSVENRRPDEQGGRPGRFPEGGGRPDGGRPDGGRPGGGGPGGNNGGAQPQPTPTTPQPPQNPPVVANDCSALSSQLSEANNQLERSRQDLQRTQSNINQLQRQREQVVRNIEQEVHRQKAQLGERVEQLRQEVYNLEASVNSLFARANEVNNYELPAARSQLANSQSQRPGVVARLNSAQAKLSQVTADYRAYKVSVNYDALSATVRQTASVVSTIKSTIASHRQQIANRDALIVEKTNLRNSLSTQIDSTNNSIASTQARLDQVEASLVPYTADKAEVVGRLNERKGILTGLTNKFAKLLGL